MMTGEFDPTRLRDHDPLPDALRPAPGRHPYYIVTPRYIRTSAGIKALHLLCHCLNRAGLEAYVVIYPAEPGLDPTDPGLLTPIANAAVALRHRAAGVSPILVYPEVIPGNPFGAHTIVRYVLNFPGLLGGDTAYPPRELVFGYSRVLATRAGSDQVVFIPTSDPTVFTPDPPRERRGACFWAMKYRLVHDGALFPVTAGAVEITRDLPASQTPAEIADLFRRSEVFYAYENTALALEAALCLCPTVFLPNPWLDEVIAVRELGWDGFAWGTKPTEVARAKATVHQARARYLANYARFWEQLSVFADATQARAAADAARHAFPRRLAWRLSWAPQLQWASMLTRVAWSVLWREGPISVLRRTHRFLGRRRAERSHGGARPADQRNARRA